MIIQIQEVWGVAQLSAFLPGDAKCGFGRALRGKHLYH